MKEPIAAIFDKYKHQIRLYNQGKTSTKSTCTIICEGQPCDWWSGMGIDNPSTFLYFSLIDYGISCRIVVNLTAPLWGLCL